MANIVELNEMADKKLEEMLENAREEMFNLRFQRAATRLQDLARPKQVRREIAQIESVLHARRLAINAAATQPEVAQALEGQTWTGEAHYSYEDKAWLVTFSVDERQVAQANVDLNKRKPRGRKERAQGKTRQVVTRYDVG
jgi:large subunit ribosomal protein L29